MEIPSAFNSGVQGLHQANERADKAAIDINSQSIASHEASQQESSRLSSQEAPQAISATAEQTPNLTQSIVELKVAEIQARTSAEVVKTADENLGTLIDIRA